jgi:hypothetical protein
MYVPLFITSDTIINYVARQQEEASKRGNRLLEMAVMICSLISFTCAISIYLGKIFFKRDIYVSRKHTNNAY